MDNKEKHLCLAYEASLSWSMVDTGRRSFARLSVTTESINHLMFISHCRFLAEYRHTGIWFVVYKPSMRVSWRISIMMSFQVFKLSCIEKQSHRPSMVAYVNQTLVQSFSIRLNERDCAHHHHRNPLAVVYCWIYREMWIDLSRMWNNWKSTPSIWFSIHRRIEHPSNRSISSERLPSARSISMFYIQSHQELTRRRILQVYKK